MPWSDWIQSEDYFTAPTRLRFQELYGASPSVTGSISTGLPTASAGFPTVVAGQGEQTGTQFTDTREWVTDRDWRPVELRSLVAGVDYDVRPDRTPSDDDAYVQYESDGPNHLVAWLMTQPKVTSVTGSSPWALYLVEGTSMVMGSNPSPSAGGVAFAFGDSTTPVGTVLPAPPQPTTSQFSIIARLSQPFVETSMGAMFGVPTIEYQMPRWRYWKLGAKPPLRLRQRDDNLFLNAGRIRNRASRQTTNRLRSYD